jgi:hypothetical protein
MFRVFVALVTQHAIRMHHTVICGFSGSALFFQIFSKTAQNKKKKVTEHKLWVSIFSTTLAENFFFLIKTEQVMIENEY